jgi:hypothetical protein
MALAACGAGKIPHQLVKDFDKRSTRLIAVLETANPAADPQAARILRVKVAEGLYFKGYPRLPANVIDALVAQLSAGGAAPSAQQIGQALQVDAILYTTLKEARPGRGLFTASTAVAAEFELKSARTGETLWQARHGVSMRSYAITPKRVELKSVQVYEPAIQEVVDRALETLPDAGGG